MLLTFSVNAEELTVMCFGDSITHKGLWVKMVDEDPLFKTVNAGKSGRKAAEAKESLAVYLKEHRKADKLIMFLGTNDLPARDKRPGNVKVDLCVKNMAAAIDLALKSFKPQDIILVGPCSVNPRTMSEVNLKKGYDITGPLLIQLGEKYNELADKKGLKFLSLLNVVSPENYKDGLHPDKAGDEEIAKAVLAFLKSNYPD